MSGRTEALIGATADGTLRLLVFNAQHAAPGRARRQAAWIAGQDGADVVVITEVGAGPGGLALIGALREHGYGAVLGHEPAAPDYRAILAARGPDLTAVPSGIDVLPHRAPAAALDLGGQIIGLLGLYVPSRGQRQRRNASKRAFQQSVTRALPGFLARFSGPVVVAGDLNVVEPGHVPHLPVFGAWEYDFYRSFLDAGMADAFRAAQPDAVDHSWFGRSNGYRIDHVFVTGRHVSQVRDCRYLHAPRHRELTDHAAMTLTLGPGAGGGRSGSVSRRGGAVEECPQAALEPLV